MQLKLMRQVNPSRLGRAANDAEFIRRPARLWHVTYHLRDGQTGAIPMVSQTKAGAIRRVLDILSDTPPRLVNATPAQVDQC